HALHLHARGARADQPRGRLPAFHQEHQRRQGAPGGDRLEVDRGHPQGARPQGADRRGEGAPGLAGAQKLMDAALRLGAADEAIEVLRIDTEALVGLLESEALEGGHVMERFATMIQREFTLPALLAQVRRLSGPLTEEMSSLSLTLYRLSLWLRSPRPYLMLV